MGRPDGASWPARYMERWVERQNLSCGPRIMRERVEASDADWARERVK